MYTTTTTTTTPIPYSTTNSRLIKLSKIDRAVLLWSPPHKVLYFECLRCIFENAGLKFETTLRNDVEDIFQPLPVLRCDISALESTKFDLNFRILRWVEAGLFMVMVDECCGCACSIKKQKKWLAGESIGMSFWDWIGGLERLRT
jgi:hypothetical protein